MNRQEILASIEHCKRAIDAGYARYTKEVGQGLPSYAANTLSAIHTAEKELGRLRALLADVDRRGPSPHPRGPMDDALGVPEDGVPIVEPATLGLDADRPWWKRLLQLP